MKNKKEKFFELYDQLQINKNKLNSICFFESPILYVRQWYVLKTIESKLNKHSQSAFNSDADSFIFLVFLIFISIVLVMGYLVFISFMTLIFNFAKLISDYKEFRRVNWFFVIVLITNILMIYLIL